MLAPLFVDVAVHQPAAIVDRACVWVSILILAVAAVREVAGDDVVAADVQLDAALMDLLEAGFVVAIDPFRCACAVAVPAAVVVASEQQFVPGEIAHQLQRVGDAAHCHVAQYPHRVVGLHQRVPPFDQRPVHVIDIAERSTGVLDDVGVTEVEVGGEPRRHGNSLARQGWRSQSVFKEPGEPCGR